MVIDMSMIHPLYGTMNRKNYENSSHTSPESTINIQFIMEIEKNEQLAFLDVMLAKKSQSKGYTIYRKSTHTGNKE